MSISCQLRIIFLIAVVCAGIIFYLIRRRKPIPLNYRMLVAIHRRQAGIARFLEWDQSNQDRHINKLENEWALLNGRFNKIGVYGGGFGGSKNGLPSGSEDEWTSFVLFELQDFEAFQACQYMLDLPEFQNLRNFCDIRLLFGHNPMTLQGMIKEMF